MGQSASVTHITRNEWKKEVNNSSMGGRWIIVTMVENSGNLKDNVVQELHKIGNEYSSNSRMSSNDNSSSDIDDDEDDDCCNDKNGKNSFRLLTINANDAIPNWPAERVPAMFAYRDGIKRREWIASRRGEFPSKAHI